MNNKIDFTLSVCLDCFTYKEIPENDYFYHHYDHKAETFIDRCNNGWEVLETEIPATHYLKLESDYSKFSTRPCDCCNSYSYGARYTYNAIKKNPDQLMKLKLSSLDEFDFFVRENGYFVREKNNLLIASNYEFKRMGQFCNESKAGFIVTL
jgi:hypothetical protein